MAAYPFSLPAAFLTPLGGGRGIGLGERTHGSEPHLRRKTLKAVQAVRRQQFIVGPKRDDKLFIGGRENTPKTYWGLEVSAHSCYGREDASVAPYDYHRHLAGVPPGGH